jgi:hypothetical protein
MIPSAAVLALQSALAHHQAVFPIQPQSTKLATLPVFDDASVSSEETAVALFQPSVPVCDDVGASRRQDLIACLSSDTQIPTSFTPDERSLIIDTGASITITNDTGDFPNGLREIRPLQLKGIASGLAVKGVGTAEYHFRMDYGTCVSLLLPNVLYVPGCPMCLLCPRHVAEHTKGVDDGFNYQQEKGVFTIYGKTLTVAYHPTTGLPFIVTAPGIRAYCAFIADPFQSIPDIQQSSVLLPSQRAKLILHERFNHVSMKTLSKWIRAGLHCGRMFTD